MTKEEAKKYIDNYISHIIAMTEYGNWFSSEIKSIVNECIADCNKIIEEQISCSTKKQSKICIKAIENRLDECASAIYDFIVEQTDDLIDLETDWLDRIVAEPLGIKFNYPDKAKTLMLSIPIASAGIVGLYGSNISNRLKNIYEQKVMSSYVSGLPFEDLEDSYTPKFNTFYRGLESDSVTLGSSLTEQYDRIIYKSNEKKIKGYIWSAILDSHTCLVCGEMDGKKFTDLDKVPIYPAHNACRCNLLVFTEDIEDSIPETYSEWFETQSDTEKRHILGKSRFQLYEQGMKIKNFVNNGKITPLKDLKK